MFTIFKELEEQNQGRIQGVWHIFANWRNGETGKKKSEIFGKLANFAIYVCKVLFREIYGNYFVKWKLVI